MGQSHRTNAHDTTIAMVSTATATHRQHSPATAVVRPPGAVPEAMLDAARQLLHNPPGLHASPSVVEQWHHDANQLIVVAINTMPHRGRQANHPSGAAGEPPQWGASAVCGTLYHTQFLCQNQVLIVCMIQDQLFHTYGPKVFTDNQMS
jgi:hypothetical protein